MAVLKCKMCGGELNLEDGMTVAECEYCGSKQTVPTADNEKKMTLFARANRLRAACEFDKAAGIYENIIADFPEEAEAYWGLVLCKFGIEYVDDPATGKKIPTCHRSSFDSIMDDDDFEQVMENADSIARRVYREEAKAIEEIRKGIIEVSSKEEPYDIFICYKETDENGERTIDSVIAQDIYKALTDEGYRVFFARISLEDKLGTAYEPYIFAALNSAKVMLAVGTDYEYYNAVWVKNEWSRFLALIAKGEKKTLIPCYKDIDAYDIPKEFKHLQAQDMGKVGAMQDLLRGVGKILGSKKQSEQKIPSNNVVDSNVSAMIQRGNLALEDKKWDDANKFFDEALNADPESAEAYLGLAMAKEKFRNKDEFAEQYLVNNSTIIAHKEFERAAKFSTGDFKNWLTKLEDERRVAHEEADKRLAPIQKQFAKYGGIITAGKEHTLGLKEDGTVVAVGSNYHGQCNVASWKDIVAVSAGEEHTVGLKSDGTVVATKYIGNQRGYYGRCDVSDWTDIVAVAAGYDHTVGLRADGTVVTTINNHRSKVSEWTDITAVSAGLDYTVGLKADGTIVTYGSWVGMCDVTDLRDIVAVSAGYMHTVGLKSDGTVVAVGNNAMGQCDVSDWKDIVAVSAGTNYTVGLKANGTVVATGFNGQRKFSDWKDIVAVSAGDENTVGLKSDGTVVAVSSNASGRCDVRSWKLFKTEEEKQADYTKACALQESGEEKKLAKAALIFSVLKDYQDSADRAAECDRIYNELKSEREAREKVEREAREAREKAEREARKARERAEKEAARERARQEKIASLNIEKSNLQTELSNLKGLFTGKRRKQIEARLAEIEEELKKL